MNQNLRWCDEKHTLVKITDVNTQGWSRSPAGLAAIKPVCLSLGDDWIGWGSEVHLMATAVLDSWLHLGWDCSLQGETGLPGERGPAGMKGLEGSVGDQGRKGDPGAKGQAVSIYGHLTSPPLEMSASVVFSDKILCWQCKPKPPLTHSAWPPNVSFRCTVCCLELMCLLSVNHMMYDFCCVLMISCSHKVPRLS